MYQCIQILPLKLLFASPWSQRHRSPLQYRCLILFRVIMHFFFYPQIETEFSLKVASVGFSDIFSTLYFRQVMIHLPRSHPGPAVELENFLNFLSCPARLAETGHESCLNTLIYSQTSGMQASHSLCSRS